MQIVYLLLGSNIGNSNDMLQTATEFIEKEVGNVLRKSSCYATAAWGFKEQPDFLNQVLEVKTAMSPIDLLKCCLSIEQKMGRVRTVKNAPRIIDIDILFYGNDIIKEDGLQVPHPEIPNRRFVLVPMTELSKDFIHPVLGRNMSQLLADCADTLNVKKN